MSDDTCDCDPTFSTSHLVLGGTALTALLGLVGYAAVHNKRHRYEFDYIQDQLDENYGTLTKLLPGYEDAYEETHVSQIARHRPAGYKRVMGHISADRLDRSLGYIREANREADEANEAAYGPKSLPGARALTSGLNAIKTAGMTVGKHYTVHGTDYFPDDMLRYDDASFASPEDEVRAASRGPRDINLFLNHRPQYRKGREPSAARWASFGWRVVTTPRKY